MNEENKNENSGFGDIDIMDELTRDQGSDELYEYKSQEKKDRMYTILNNVFIILILIMGFGIYVLFNINKFYVLNGEDELTSAQETFIKDYKSKQKTIYGYLGISTTDAKTLFEPDLEGNPQKEIQPDSSKEIADSLKKFIASKEVSYVDKKEAIKSFTNELSTKLVKGVDNIKELKLNIGVYGFLPKELDSIVKDSELQRSILSIEAIKLYTALKIFSNLDSFLQEVADTTSVGSSNPKIWKNVIDNYLTRGEIDIKRYLQSCLLNPVENENCSFVGDFDRFYRLYTPKIGKNEFEANQFKQLMNILNTKLEKSIFPKLSIVLNTFEPSTNVISFTIDINTFQEDESDLLAKQIINPHIYIVTTMLNLLRQSHFIVGEGINIDSLTVNERSLDIGGKKYEVNNSNFSFSIPVQKSVEREIYDYVYEN